MAPSLSGRGALANCLCQMRVKSGRECQPVEPFAGHSSAICNDEHAAEVKTISRWVSSTLSGS